MKLHQLKRLWKKMAQIITYHHLRHLMNRGISNECLDRDRLYQNSKKSTKLLSSPSTWINFARRRNKCSWKLQSLSRRRSSRCTVHLPQLQTTLNLKGKNQSLNHSINMQDKNNQEKKMLIISNKLSRFCLREPDQLRLMRSYIMQVSNSGRI